MQLTPCDPAAAPAVSSWARSEAEVSAWCSRTEVPVPAGVISGWSEAVCAGERLEHGQPPTDPLSVGIVVQALGPGLDARPPASECPTLRALGRP